MTGYYSYRLNLKQFVIRLQPPQEVFNFDLPEDYSQNSPLTLSSPEILTEAVKVWDQKAIDNSIPSKPMAIPYSSRALH
jgi:hypothetical protein